jgi:hypothetical protein
MNLNIEGRMRNMQWQLGLQKPSERGNISVHEKTKIIRRYVQ